MFEVGGTYTNRVGTYKVLEMGSQKMKVRYENGEEAELRIAIQERIWVNIQAEMEAKDSRSKKKSTGPQANHYIKTISTISEEELNPSDIRTTVAPCSTSAPEFNHGDRFIYYSITGKSFFAVATITGDPKQAPADNFPEMDFETEKVNIFPIDIDAFATSMDNALWLDSVELESQPQFKDVLTKGEIYLKISEDDFELLAESLTEFVEQDDDDSSDDDLEDEEEELLLEDDLDI